jgi:hypothetical protein
MGVQLAVIPHLAGWHGTCFHSLSMEQNNAIVGLIDLTQKARSALSTVDSRPPLGKYWSMEFFQISSVGFPFSEPGLTRLGIHVLMRAASMGLFDRDQVISRLDWESYQALIRTIATDGGLGQGLVAEAISLTPTSERLAYQALLERVADALEASPVPDREWRPMLDVFAHQDLAPLLGASSSSIRRYADGSRTTPQEIAERLHFLALVVGDLAGAYNAFGVRRWFKRRRKLLSGKAPADLLKGAWAPDDRGPMRVRELAHTLVSLAAT